MQPDKIGGVISEEDYNVDLSSEQFFGLMEMKSQGRKKLGQMCRRHSGS